MLCLLLRDRATQIVENYVFTINSFDSLNSNNCNSNNNNKHTSKQSYDPKTVSVSFSACIFYHW